ncbi:M28 family peptidase [Robiginitalea sp. M366]|uniref:M28 family peptidase n=1 Tax=Robiginitalea aestuariiviva TaxID=3036903 RepID=UPI00240DDA48|nr:M28 family peptidase [Robiginitalea aestuariiviva]MDG1571535.1 M28 family peptidase [Robiginitalea aestuariiviva]
MKYAQLFLGTALVLAACRTEAPVEVTLQEDVGILAADSLMGRETGTDGARMAADYLEGRLRNMGLKPAGAQGTYRQTFVFKPRRDPHAQITFEEADSAGIAGMNVMGLIDKGGSRTVVLGAHYDHLGMGGEGSLHRGEAAVHNGADDNASGVAVLLHLAQEINRWEEARDNYLILLFSGEEMGLLGSNYFSKNPTLSLDEVPFMLNLDMVGRLRPDSTLSVSGTGTSPIWNQVLNSQNPGFKLVLQESGVGPSDHTSFYLQDIPVLHFFTGQHPDYHRPSDDAGKLNYEGMEAISAYLMKVLRAMETQREVAFRKTKNESEEVPAFKVALGVVPDYLFEGPGMRIDGVSEGKAAQQAGLQKGDVVLRLGDSTVTDMMSYMRALASFQPGDSTEVVVGRGTDSLRVSVRF